MNENELKAASENAARAKLMAEAVETYTEPHFVDGYKNTILAAKILRAATATVSGLSATAFFGGLVYFNLPTYIGGGFAVAVAVASGIGAAAAIEYLKATESKKVFRGFFAKGSGLVPKTIFVFSVAASIATSLLGSETTADLTKKKSRQNTKSNLQPKKPKPKKDTIN